MARPQQIEMKLRAPQCLNSIPFSARAQCPGTGTKSGQGLTFVKEHPMSLRQGIVGRSDKEWTKHFLCSHSGTQ